MTRRWHAAGTEMARRWHDPGDGVAPRLGIVCRMLSTGSIDARIMALAGEQHGVAHRHQLRALFVSRSAIARRVRAGLAREELPGVHAFGPAAHHLGIAGTMMAAVLYLGPDAAVNHATAAARHGLWDRDDGTVHVVTTQRRRPMPPGFPVVQHRSIHPVRPSCVAIDGIPTTSVTRTIVEAGQVLTKFQLAHVIHGAEFSGTYDAEAVRALLRQRHAEPGTRIALDAVAMHELGSAGTRSRTEDRLLVLLIRLGAPEPCVNWRTIPGLRGYEPDLAWPDRRLIVEIDGDRGHSQAGMATYDAEREATYRREGWKVLRFPSSMVWTDLDTVAHAIMHALRAA